MKNEKWSFRRRCGCLAIICFVQEFSQSDARPAFAQSSLPGGVWRSPTRLSKVVASPIEIVCARSAIDFTNTQAVVTSRSQCNLVPLRTYHDDFKFLSRSDEYRCCFDNLGRYYGNKDGKNNADNLVYYELGLVEENDLPDVSRFIVQAFGADAINLSQDITGLERMLVKPAIELVNGYSGIVAFAEVLAGLRSRLRFRFSQNRNGYAMDMKPPNLEGLSRDEQMTMAASTSIILAVTKKKASNNEKDWRSDVIASVELRLQPCDAKIPFTLPWLDMMERKMASLIGLNNNEVQRNLQPYLSNLCVDESYRGQGLGRALVRCVEDISCSAWGYSRLYLHVDVDNVPALELYQSEGYSDVGRRWNPFWVGRAADIGYYVKNIRNGNNDQGTNTERVGLKTVQIE